MVSIKYLNNICTILEVLLIKCEVNLILGWRKQCLISSNALETQPRKFAITNTKLYVPVVTLSTQDIAKLFEQLKSGFK